MRLTITVNGLEESLQAITDYKGAADPAEIANGMRDRVEKAVNAHFIAINSSKPNKLGGRRTNYWLMVGEESRTTVSGNGVSIVFPTIGFRRHVLGGPPIRPSGRTSEITGKPIRFLTIPKHPAAHGQTVAKLRAQGINLYRDGGALKRSENGQRSENDPVYFVLAKQTKAAAPNPSLLPSNESLIKAAEEAVADLEAAIKAGY